MSNRSKTSLVGFIFNNKLTLILVLVLLALIKQNFFTNNFPSVVSNKQLLVNKIKKSNYSLEIENTSLEKKINSFQEKNLSLIESNARFKYGLVKEGEYFFKIKNIINNKNIEDNSESTL